MPHPLNIPTRAWKYWSRFSRLGREAKAKHGVSKWRILREHWALRGNTGLRLDEYFFFGLFDPDMPTEAKEEYIGQKLMRPLWSALNPIEYRYLFKNKLVFKQVCVGAGLPVADFLGVFDPDWGYAANGQPLRTAEDLARWIADIEDANVVFKPTAGAEGRMVLVFKGKTQGAAPALVAVDGEEWPAERLWRHLTDEAALERACLGAVEIAPTFLIERRLRPHPALAALSPETLCTIRVLTLRDRGTAPHVMRAIFKLQTSASGLDNLAQGSVAIGVDMETGKLRTGWVKPKKGEMADLARLDTDPASGLEFVGKQLPCWEEVMDVAVRGAAAFSSVRSLGWDIAVTPDGPAILEGNWNWCEKHGQCGFGRGLWHGDFKTVSERLIAEGKVKKPKV